MECINAFVRSNEEYDKNLKNDIKSTIKIKDNGLTPFLTSLKYPLDIYYNKHKHFNNIFQESLTDVMNKVSMVKESKSPESFYINMIDNTPEELIIEQDEEYEKENVITRDVYIKGLPWEIALRALCKTIINPKWYNKIQSLDEVPLSLVISLKDIQYFSNILPSISESYQITKSYNKKSISKVINTYRTENNLDCYKTEKDSVNITKKYVKIYDGKSTPYDINENVIEMITLIYIYANYRYSGECQRLTGLKTNLNYRSKHIDLLCNPAFTFSFVMMCLFEKCFVTSDHTCKFHDFEDIEVNKSLLGRTRFQSKEIYVNSDFLECYQAHIDTFDILDNITEELRLMLINDEVYKIKNFKGINKFVTDLDVGEMHKHIKNYKSNSKNTKWSAVETYSDKIQNLHKFLDRNNMLFEQERLRKFFENKDQKHYVFLRFKERVTEYELDMTLRSIMLEEPQIENQTDEYTIINMTEGSICLVIKIPLLFAIRDVSYSYVFSNPKRITKTVPMYPIYLCMLYTEYAYIDNYESKEHTNVNNDIALRSVVRILSTWITKQSNIHTKILEVSDPLFFVYRLLVKILSKWDSIDVLFEDILESYKSYVFDPQFKGRADESSLFSGILGFITLREEHYIERDGVEMMNVILEDEERKDMLMNVFPDLCEYYIRLKRISNKANTDSINMKRVNMNGLWKNVEKCDKGIMCWIESYILCSTMYLKNSEARFLFCSIRPKIMPNARKNFSGKHFQEELSSSMKVYLERFSKRTTANYYGSRRPVKETSLKTDRKEIVCLMFRMMEWASLHQAEVRGELLENNINPLGPCNIEVFDLLYSPSLLPVSIKKMDNQVNLVYTDESLFICKLPTSIEIVNNNVSSSKNQIASTGALDVQHYIIDIVFHYYKYMCNNIANSKYMNNLGNFNPNMLFMDAIDVCNQNYVAHKERVKNRKRKLNWDHYFNAEGEEYERARKIRVSNKEILNESPAKSLYKLVFL